MAITTKRALEQYQALADAAQIQARHNTAAASRAAQERLHDHGIEPVVRPVVTDPSFVLDYLGAALITLACVAFTIVVVIATGP